MHSGFTQDLLPKAMEVHFDSTKLTRLGFERVLNTFVWNGAIRYAAQLGDSRISLKQQARSRLIRSEQQSIQDEYQDTIDVRTLISGNWNLQAVTSSNILKDNRALDLGGLAQHQILGGLAYENVNGVSVTGMGGVEFAAQEKERDRGIAYLVNANVPNIPLDEIQGSLNSSWARSFLGRREPEQRNLDVRLRRNFSEGTEDLLEVKYEKQRREFYVAADPAMQTQYGISSNVFTRNEEVVDVSNNLRYRVGEQTSLSMNAGLTNRKVDRSLRYQGAAAGISDPQIQVSQLRGELSITSVFDEWGSTTFGIQHTEREESHSTHFLDNVSQRTALTGLLNVLLGEQDRMRIRGSANILRYDTPDLLNVDDRDELLVTVGLEETHVLNKYVVLNLESDITLNHLVYLHNTQSANNNWNRVLRFSPGVVYTPSDRIRSSNVAEVMANYTVYDFEEQVAFVRSFSFRQASWFDTTVVRLSPHLQFMFSGGARVYERGILRWREFTERPEKYFVDQSYWPQLFFSGALGVRVGIGFRYFSQDRYAYQGSTRVRDLTLETSGPTAQLAWVGQGGEEVVFDGWSETQKVNGQTLASVPNLTVRVSFGL